MTFDELQRSVESRDRQLDAIVSTVASLPERLTQLTTLAEIQNTRITRLEGE